MDVLRFLVVKQLVWVRIFLEECKMSPIYRGSNQFLPDLMMSLPRSRAAALKVEPETQAELPLSRAGRWDALPSTKIKRPKRGDPFAWAYTYTSYSVDFAIQALLRLGASKKTLVLDPFVGSGTTLLACSLIGCSGLGIDISPFSLLLSRTRTAWRPDERLVSKYLKANPSLDNQNASATHILSARDASYVNGVIRAMCKYQAIRPDALWCKLLNDTKGHFDSEAVTLLSLTLGARTSAHVEKGSNPIWYKKIAEASATSESSLRDATIACARSICRDLLGASEGFRKNIRMQQHDFVTLNSTRLYDLCLTSPPYINRLDYVVAHLPELSVLQHLVPFNLDQLRNGMIGTTKIVQKYTSTAAPEWGELCKQTLENIYNHSSYASRRYYYHIHTDYFRRLSEATFSLARVMQRRSEGILVLQDSFYKDLKIQTPQICLEMLNNAGFSATIVRTTVVKAHMGRLSPAQTLYAPQKTLGESVIYFERS